MVNQVLGTDRVGIFHVGDLIGIGPHPREVFDLATAQENITYIMGNHDYWFAYGLPVPQPNYMSDEEVEHQKWNHRQIGETRRHLIHDWKFVEHLLLPQNRRITFQHYGYDSEENWFKSYIKTPDSESLNHMFIENDSDIIFYGHNHEASDIIGNSRYVNLGSAGCYDRAEVRLGVLEVSDKELQLKKYSVPYDDNGLMEDFENRNVPARAFITSHFITR